jgi:hypothetical protein
MPPSTGERQGSPEKSWEMIDTLLMTGEIVLGNGEVRKATNREIISAMLFAAGRQPRKQQSVPLLDDLSLGRTDE